jgi:hypothetical protein
VSWFLFCWLPGGRRGILLAGHTRFYQVNPTVSWLHHLLYNATLNCHQHHRCVQRRAATAACITDTYVYAQSCTAALPACHAVAHLSHPTPSSSTRSPSSQQTGEVLNSAAQPNNSKLRIDTSDNWQYTYSCLQGTTPALLLLNSTLDTSAPSPAQSASQQPDRPMMSAVLPHPSSRAAQQRG